MADIFIDDRRLIAALNQLLSASTNMRPALLEIGDVLTKSTKKRFSTTTAPDGSSWAKNKDSTLLYKPGNQPLTDRGILGDTINSQMQGNDAVAIGSPQEYAAMQQFGGTKAEFPNLWGDIPAREFLGISNEDENNILSIISDHLSDIFR